MTISFMQSRKRALCRMLALISVAATGCTVVKEQSVSLASEPRAIAIGPLEACGGQPKIFLGSMIEDDVLAELVPYRSLLLVLRGNRMAEECSHEATYRLIENRPDAIVVFPGDAKVTGVHNSAIYTPWTGIHFLAGAEVETATIGYAMRAVRTRLPFTHDRVTGLVREIHDREAAPGLLEGDTITEIAGATALPPKAWPNWDFYTTWLGLRPGDEVDLAWIRPGVGKMNGRARMLTALSPHLAVADSISKLWMPPIVTKVQDDGRETWGMAHRRWYKPISDRGADF